MALKTPLHQDGTSLLCNLVTIFILMFFLTGIGNTTGLVMVIDEPASSGRQVTSWMWQMYLHLTMQMAKWYTMLPPAR